jgi:hypothetical protein
LALDAGWHVVGQHFVCRSSPELVLGRMGNSPMGSETDVVLAFNVM